jgi:N-acetylmuramoyl-L-alanine amidase
LQVIREPPKGDDSAYLRRWGVFCGVEQVNLAMPGRLVSKHASFIRSVHGRRVARYGKQPVNWYALTALIWLIALAAPAVAQTEVGKTRPAGSSGGVDVAKMPRDPEAARQHENSSVQRSNLSTTASGLVATDVRLASKAGRTLFELDLSKSATAQVFVLATPDRVVIDIPELDFALPAGIGRQALGLVSAFRFGQFAAGRSRIVIDVTGPVRIIRQGVVPASVNQPVRLQVELEAAASPAAETPAAVLEPSLPPREAPAPLAERKQAARFVIVIDPGHGGIDGGAISGSQVPEKDIVLAVSRQLKATLDARKRYDVRMTRNTDVFISLDQRVEISQAAEASLFISIHADSVGDASLARTARGASIYTLSETASNQAAQQYAEKENAADVASGVTGAAASEREQVNSILVDLVKRETQNFSLEFKGLLVDRLRPINMLSRDPSRAAAFKVLRQTQTPTVLIELGFLTHEMDAQQMQTVEWQKKIATSISAAVDSYVTRRGVP